MAERKQSFSDISQKSFVLIRSFVFPFLSVLIR